MQTSSLYKSPEEHYVDYFQNRDPRMKMTLYAPGDKWPGGDDGDPDTDKANEIFNLPRFASLQDNNRVGANSRTGFYLKSITILIWPAQVWVGMGISMSSVLPKSC